MPLPGEAVEGDFDDDDEALPPEGEDQQEMTVEDQARLRGWKPLAEYKGPPGRWRSAEEYLRIGDSDNAVLREENRRLTQRLHRVEGQLTTMDATLKELRDYGRRAEKQGYDRALAELQAQRREAVAGGDTDAFEDVERKIAALQSERPPPAPPPPPTEELKPQIPEPVQTFIAANAWYRTDPVLQNAMMRQYDIVAAMHPTWEMDDVLAEAKDRLIRDFPEKFNMPNDDRPPARERPRGSSVHAPSGRTPPPRRDGAGWNRIPEEERAEAKRAYQNGLRADPDQPESEFIEIYVNPRADAIELRRQRPKKV